MGIDPHSSFTCFTLFTVQVARSVCLSVSLSVTVVSPAKTTEPIEMPLGLWTRVCRSKHLLHGANWRNLANTIEPFMCGGDAAFCHVTRTCRYIVCAKLHKSTFYQKSNFLHNIVVGTRQSITCNDFCARRCRRHRALSNQLSPSGDSTSLSA